jgi:CheY-like chemotaxis protein
MEATMQRTRDHILQPIQSSQSLPKQRILCVDDNLDCLEARAALLEDEGYSVIAVSCPLMALKCDVSNFHLAILDFDMPAMNGFQLLLRLRAARAAYPIMLLSGRSRDLPNDMRTVFTSCHDKGEPVHHLLDTVRSYLTSTPDPWMDCDARPLYRRHGH